jgi:hypothetical protein
VGLALKKDKRKKHISDKLVRMAAEEGITLRFIDKEQPLEEQGPFAAILQKVRKPGAPPPPLPHRCIRGLCSGRWWPPASAAEAGCPSRFQPRCGSLMVPWPSDSPFFASPARYRLGGGPGAVRRRPPRGTRV